MRSALISALLVSALCIPASHTLPNTHRSVHYAAFAVAPHLAIPVTKGKKRNPTIRIPASHNGPLHQKNNRLLHSPPGVQGEREHVVMDMAGGPLHKQNYLLGHPNPGVQSQRKHTVLEMGGRSDVGAGSPTTIVFPGGGIYFWWQAGAAKSLLQHYNLSKAHLMGASAGALTAALAACDIDFDRAFEVAQRLAMQYDIYDRPGGLMGIWGGIIYQWLDELLPDDAAKRCNRRLSISVAEVTWKRPPKLLNRRLIDTYESKEDVIEACMTSVHIPFFLDKKPWRDFRGGVCIDGSITSLARGKKWHVKKDEPVPTMLVDHADDLVLKGKDWGFLETLSEAGFREMFNMGYQHMEALHAQGVLSERDATLGDILIA